MTPDPAWVSNRDVTALEDALDKVAAQLHNKRKEATKTNLSHAIMFSVGIFIVLLVGLSFVLPDVSFGENAFIGTTNQTTTDALKSGNVLQFSLIVAASGGIIPGVAYAMVRDREVQQKNEELAALGLEIKYLRSKILTLKQEEAVGRFVREGGTNRSGKDKGDPASKGGGKNATSGFGDSNF